MSQSLGFAGRIEQENWIEQAQILARGGETDYAQRRDNGAAGVQNSAAHSPQQDTATAIAAATAAATRVATVLQGPRPAKLDEAIREHAAKAATAPGRVSQPVEADVRSDMAALRSVRSEALRGDHAPIAQRPIGQVDDLKRVRGIGVLIEKKLNSLGITTYEQVANWTGADIDRISQILDFKGRIERENWVEQARILASGGQTEFARRFDRGEVDMGR
jgi:predicted flap endonuclease-1-like 5' DNA nuclease